MLLSDKYLKTGKRLIVFLFLFKNNISQNLIVNGSFESYYNINCGGGGFDNYSVFPVTHVVDNWYTLNSVDYFNTTCGFTGYGVPNSYYGGIHPKHANALAGFVTVYNDNNETKEYIYQQLSSPLQAGNIYCLSFYVSRADRISYAVKSIGAYFSNTVLSVGSLGYISANPQVVNQTGFITDTIGWTQIQGCFTANGGEEYITIGNFNSNANTDTLKIQPVNALSTSTVDIAYYYIDDITLIDQSTVGVNELSNGTSVSVYPNPANDVLNISLNTIKENLTIKITDVIGRDVLVSEYKSQLDVSFLEKGIYFVSILQGNKTLGTKKIIKQ